MILLVIIGTLPALAISYVFTVNEKDLRAKDSKQLAEIAKTLGEIIDRNLFERYGDVQAFGFNTAAYDEKNWGNPVEGNPLIGAMNNYTRAYGMYPLMMMLDTQGNVLATNNIAIDGKPIAVNFLYDLNFKDQPWFKNALEGKFTQGKNGFTGTAVGSPMQNPLLKKIYGGDGYSIAFSAQVKNSAGEMIGVWVNFFDMAIVDAMVGETFKIIQVGGIAEPDVMVIDRTGTILVDYATKELDESGKLKRDFGNLLVKNFVTNKETYLEAAELATNGSTDFWTGYSPDSGETTLFGYSQTDGTYDYAGLGWSILIGVAPDSAFATLDATKKSMNIAQALSILVSLLLGWIVGLVFSRPISGMTEVMGKLASGDTSVDIPSTENGDEIGGMARAVVVFKDNMIQAEQLRTEQEQQKILTEQQKRKAMNALADSFESNVKTVVTGVSASASQMRGNAERLSQLAGETKSNSAMVASSAGEAAQTASQVAAAAEELTAAIGEISSQVQKSSSVASQASTQAESINQSMHLLVEKSNRVGEVIQFITNIASQINLLALNATIESARAGEAGRGFAVVASEVKNLANQTAKATEEIIQQVQSMQEATHDAVDSVGQIINIISEISANTAGVAAAVEEQSAATNEISRTITSTAASTSAISHSIGSVEKGADETGLSSRQVLDSAKMLSEQAIALSARVDEFLRSVRNG
jgi:methyl-accepting chemotaxis protein